jgi:hypothetical protein
VVYRLEYGLTEDERKTKRSYVGEAVGMGFLARICGRPANERPFLLIPVGYPTEGGKVLELGKKFLDEIRVMVPSAQNT